MWEIRLRIVVKSVFFLLWVDVCSKLIRNLGVLCVEELLTFPLLFNFMFPLPVFVHKEICMYSFFKWWEGDVKTSFWWFESVQRQSGPLDSEGGPWRYLQKPSLLKGTGWGSGLQLVSPSEWGLMKTNDLTGSEGWDQGWRIPLPLSISNLGD